MKSTAPSPIPIPLAQRLHHARMQLLPALVFGAAVVTVALLWKDHVAAPTMVGQAEAVLANVSSPKPGVLAGLTVVRFQKVCAGDPLGHVLVADPKLLEASLAVIRSELDMLRASLQPIVAQQRNAVDYAQLRLDWMRQRAELASAKVNMQVAEAEFHRTDELFKSKITSQSELDIARANYQALQQQVEELTKLVAEGERSFSNLQPSNAADISRISDEPMRAAIAVQEARLRLTEAELGPLLLRAPQDGVVTTIYHCSGEAVIAGQPIVTIASTTSPRIVGYLRAPFQAEPKPGDRVQVRSRNAHRDTGMAQIVEIGAQIEPVPVVLQSTFRLAGAELALPVEISLPPNLTLRPGELVDLTLLAGSN